MCFLLLQPAVDGLVVAEIEGLKVSSFLQRSTSHVGKPRLVVAGVLNTVYVYVAGIGIEDFETDVFKDHLFGGVLCCSFTSCRQTDDMML